MNRAKNVIGKRLERQTRREGEDGRGGRTNKTW